MATIAELIRRPYPKDTEEPFDKLHWVITRGVAALGVLILVGLFSLYPPFALLLLRLGIWGWVVALIFVMPIVAWRRRWRLRRIAYIIIVTLLACLVARVAGVF